MFRWGVEWGEGSKEANFRVIEGSKRANVREGLNLSLGLETD